MNAGANAPSTPFGAGLGSQLCGATSIDSSDSQAVSEDQQESDKSASDADDDEDGSGSELVIAMASASVEESPWLASPAYKPPLYLSTIGEYLPPAPKSKVPAGVDVHDPALDDEEKGKGPSWAFEGYENSVELDHVFERFLKRAGFEGQQCLRLAFLMDNRA